MPIGRHPTELVARVAVQGEGGAPERDSSGEEVVEEDESEEGDADLGSSGRSSVAAADSDVKQAWTSFRVVASNPDIDLTALAKPGEWRGHSLGAYLDVVMSGGWLVSERHAPILV